MKKFSFAVVSEQRERSDMEDTHCVVPRFSGKHNWFFGGVFDGHGGSQVADELARQMPAFMKNGIAVSGSVKEAFKNAYAKASNEPWAQTDVGACAATFLIQDRTVTCANAGDCRILALGNSARMLTRLHGVSNKAEVKRIQTHGGIISWPYVYCRGQGLMPTRTIGDLPFKKIGVTSVPFVSVCDIRDTDRFIVAGSDGLFDDVPNKRAFEISRGIKTAEELVRALKEEVDRRGGSDNLTIVVVRV